MVVVRVGTDGGGRGHLQVHGLEHEVGGGGQLDDLAAHQAQLLVVVQHRVHVLDPDGVHRPVKQQPLAVRCLYTHIFMYD